MTKALFARMIAPIAACGTAWPASSISNHPILSGGICSNMRPTDAKVVETTGVTRKSVDHKDSKITSRSGGRPVLKFTPNRTPRLCRIGVVAASWKNIDLEELGFGHRAMLLAPVNLHGSPPKIFRRRTESRVRDASTTPNFRRARVLPDPNRASFEQRPGHVLFFYLDTPLLVQRLGLEADSKQNASRELINLLTELGGKVVAFSHSRQERHGVLLGAAANVDSPNGRGLIVREARKRGTTRSDLLLLAESIDDKLGESGIRVEDTPRKSPP